MPTGGVPWCTAVPPGAPRCRGAGGGSRPPAAASVPVGFWGRPMGGGAASSPLAPPPPAVRGGLWGSPVGANPIDPSVKSASSLVT